LIPAKDVFYQIKCKFLEPFLRLFSNDC
jgi:hypothetical protein